MKIRGRQSENDDCKTFISSTDRHGDSISIKSKGYMTNAHFKVKRINKKTSYNTLNKRASMTPDKQSHKINSNKIMIKQNDVKRL